MYTDDEERTEEKTKLCPYILSQLKIKTKPYYKRYSDFQRKWKNFFSDIHPLATLLFSISRNTTELKAHSKLTYATSYLDISSVCCMY